MRNAINTKEETHKGYKITIGIFRDEDMGPPWEEHDGHGIVSERTTRDKAPGELVLHADGRSKRYYDFKATLEIAKRDGWGWLPAELETGRDEPENPANLAGWARCGKYYAHDATNFNRAISAVYTQHRATMTAKQYVAGAVQKDFEHLKAWCEDEWQWVGYVAEIQTPDGEEIEGDSCWGIDDEDYAMREALDNARATIDAHITATEKEQIESNAMACRDIATA